MSRVRLSVVAVALAGVSSASLAAIDMSGEAVVGIEKAGKARTSQTGDITLTFDFSQEITPDLLFSATTDTTYSVNDTDSGDVELGGSLSFTHTTWGALEFGTEVGNVFEDAKYADKSELWYTGVEDPAVGYKYSNTLGALSVSLGYFDKYQDKSLSKNVNGVTGSLGYTLAGNLQASVSAARVNGDYSTMAGAQWSEVLPGLTVAGNVGSFDGELGYGGHAQYQLLDNLSTYAAYATKGEVDDVTVGADYSLNVTNDVAYSLAASYSTNAETTTLENTVTLFGGVEVYANVDVNDDTTATYGASYTLNF